MFQLETAVAAWRTRFAARRGFLKDDLDELERHLRDDVAAAVARGVPEAEAFHTAVAAIGDMHGAEREYKKVYWGKVQRRNGLGQELGARAAIVRNYLKTTVRGLARTKGYTAINVAGLAVGLACCLVIFQYVAFETSFDRFHANETRLYRAHRTMARQGEAMRTGAFSSWALGPTLAEEVPGVRGAARIHPEFDGAVVASPLHPERVFEEEHAFYADPSFLRMFSFPLVAGDAAHALEDPGSLLISETAARRYFGSADPVGQVLDVTGLVARSYRVGGVFRDVPANSHLRFDFLFPMAALLASDNYADPETAWRNNNFYTYVLLRPGADPAAVSATMTRAFLAHQGDELREQGITASLGIQPLRDVHLNDAFENVHVVMGSYRTVYFFSVIGLVTLVIALVNYVNLATARALDRAREVGVRKAVGANRRQLVGQFLFESALTNGAAAVLAVGLAAAGLPFVNRLAGTAIPWALWASPAFWAAFVGTLAAATLLAGLYPAFVLSSFRPASALKGVAGTVAGGLRLRQGLVVLQFAASVLLIGGTAIVYDQLRYMREMDLGLDLEQVLTVPAPRVLAEGADRDAVTAAFAERLRQLPAVRQVALSTTLPGQGFNWYGASLRRAEASPADAGRAVMTWVDTSFASLYGMRLVAGDGYEAFVPPPDSGDAPIALILNETAVRSLGYASPQESVGQAIDVGDNAAVIVGVYADVNWSSAHSEREAVLFGRTTGGDQLSLRVAAADLPRTIDEIRSVYDAEFPGNVFRYGFADEAFDAQYESDQHFATLFTLFAGLAIGIACLGLFGLASFTTRQRTKEIGVRKVLGASVPGLVALLSRDFLKLVVVAVVIASPIAYLLMRKWLEGFAYHVEPGPGLFLLVGVVALSIALLSVAQQSLRAALADPSRSLRAE